MNEREEVMKLDSGVSTIRAGAAWRLRNSFDENIGDRLVDILIHEYHGNAFVLVCMAVIPKWIVKLEHKLLPLDEWPFDALRTGWLLRSLGGWRLPSIERQMHQYLKSEDWTLRLSAVEYCHDKQKYTEDASKACVEFLERDMRSADEKLKIARSLRLRSFRQVMTRVRKQARDFGHPPPSV